MEPDTKDNSNYQSIQTQLRYGDYLFSIAELTDGKINIELIDIKTF